MVVQAQLLQRLAPGFQQAGEQVVDLFGRAQAAVIVVEPEDGRAAGAAVAQGGVRAHVGLVAQRQRGVARVDGVLQGVHGGQQRAGLALAADVAQVVGHRVAAQRLEQLQRAAFGGGPAQGGQQALPVHAGEEQGLRRLGAPAGAEAAASWGWLAALPWEASAWLAAA